MPESTKEGVTGLSEGSDIGLGARCREFESPISDQTPSEINNFRGGFLFFVYCGAKIDAVIFAPHFQKSSTLYCEFCRIIV